MTRVTAYAPYIPLVTGFHITSANLIDNRTVVNTLEDMYDLSSIRLPNGLECLILDSVRSGDTIVKYRWYDGEWHPISYGVDDFNHTVSFVIADWEIEIDKPYNEYYIEVVHTGSKYPSHKVFTSTGVGVQLEYKEINTSTFRLYARHPFDGILTAN